MKRWLIFCILTAVSSSAAPAVDEYEWKPIERGTASNGVSVTGRVVPQDGALNIESARVPGRVLAILRREGESVTEGTPLYEVSSAECFSLQEERRVASNQHLDDLLEGVARRQKQLGLQLKGDQCYAVASHSGVLTKRGLESGASFNAGDALATILDVRRLTVELDIPERDQARVQAGQSVRFQFASHPGESYEANVLNIVPTIDPATRTSKARLKISSHLPKNVSLEALVFGEVRTGAADEIFRVPSSALVFSHNRQYVIRGPEDKMHSVVVQVVSEADNMSSVRPLNPTALHSGELVATRGAIFLFKKLNNENLP